MRFYIPTAFLLSVLVLQVTAQIPFNALPGPNGGSVKEIEINSDGNVFAIVGYNYGGRPYEGNLYRSINNGTNWSKISGGVLADFDAIDLFIDDNNDLYVLGKQKLYKSVDNGTTWTSKTPA